MEFTVEWHERLGSTNACMKERFFRGLEIPGGSIVAAREQTAGRGRQERKWLASPNANLCFSLYVETDCELMAVPSLTMSAALAVTEMLNAEGIRAAPKWPNDVLAADRKICGILSERVEQASGTGIIVGIGLNVNMSTEEAEAIDRPATSMLIQRGQAYDIDQTLADLLPLLEYWIGKWESGGFRAIRDIWTERAGPIGKWLSVHDGNIRKSGTLAGFGKHGELLLETKHGTETIWSGDVS